MDGLGNFCKCLCSSVFVNNEKTSYERSLDMLSYEETCPTKFNVDAIKSTYMVAANQPLRGAPIRSSQMWHITGDNKCDTIHFDLYINGFKFKKLDEDGNVLDKIDPSLGVTAFPVNEERISLNPFALVRNCKFQIQHGSLQQYKIFKISLLPQGTCYYFGLKEDEERARWVLDISHAIRLVTQSIFPNFRIRCDPIRNVPATHRRIMAGYLLHLDPRLLYGQNLEHSSIPHELTLLYCELHAHNNDCGKLVLYKNERCDDAIMELQVTQKSVCCEKVGINCSSFCFEEHNFSSRTLSERKLWLRAFSNVKVKVQNRAPSPNEEQLDQYRQAIREHVNGIMEGLEDSIRIDPLLLEAQV